MQTSGMLGLLGPGVLIGRLLVDLRPNPIVILIYWGVVLLVLGRSRQSRRFVRQDQF